MNAKLIVRILFFPYWLGLICGALIEYTTHSNWSWQRSWNEAKRGFCG
jgi:hypothetical protein